MLLVFPSARGWDVPYGESLLETLCLGVSYNALGCELNVNESQYTLNEMS